VNLAVYKEIIETVNSSRGKVLEFCSHIRGGTLLKDSYGKQHKMHSCPLT